VRATVCWIAKALDIGVGFADPARSLLAGYEDDPERDRLRRLLTCWSAIFGEQPLAVSQVVGTANREVQPPAAEADRPLPQEALAQLHDVLGEIDARLSSHKIGIYVSQQKGRIVD